MTDTDIHSCGYYCDRPLCIKAQRDELREKMYVKKEWVGLTNEEIMEITGVKSTDSDWNVVIVHKWIRAIEAKLKEKNT